MDSVVFQGVTKQFGEFKALDGFDLRVPTGQLYGLIGPNGAGKSTAIKIMLGLQRATGGGVTVLGHRPDDPDLRPLVGYMPQETALYLDLTVQENLDLFGRLYGLSPATRRQRISELLRFVDLSDWADAVIANLSGGMQHRTSLAVALLSQPRLLVLDEPTVGVDPELRAAFWAQFGQMLKHGATIIITTHYMDEAMRCQRVGLINHGRLVAQGAPADLVNQTKTQSLEAAFLAFAGRHNQLGRHNQREAQA